MKVVVFTLILLGTVTFSQVYNSGVKIEANKFTDSKSCTQSVSESSSFDGLLIYLDEASTYAVLRVARDYGSKRETIFAGQGEETITFKIGEVIRHYDIASSDNKHEYDFERVFFKLPLVDLIWLLASIDDLSVSFNGQNGREAFTIDHEVITTLAAGFGQQCLDLFEVDHIA